MNLKITDARAAEIAKIAKRWDAMADYPCVTVADLPHVIVLARAVTDFESDRTTMAAEIESWKLEFGRQLDTCTEAVAEIERLRGQLQEAQKVFDAMRKWEDDGDYDNEVAMIQARLSYSAMARQAPETAPGSDLPEGAATHVAGEAK